MCYIDGMNNRTKKVVLYGILIAVALILSYVESLIPAFFAIPGIKLGLTNLVVILALYLIGWKSALVINILRIILVSVLFGNSVSLIYSAAGAILSGAVMILLKHSGKFSMITVSIVGGVLHNVGQILVAMLILGTASVGWYLVILWFSGIAAGAVIGIISALICKRLEPHFNKIFGKIENRA